jgi:hypothetical protein
MIKYIDSSMLENCVQKHDFLVWLTVQKLLRGAVVVLGLKRKCKVYVPCQNMPKPVPDELKIFIRGGSYVGLDVLKLLLVFNERNCDVLTRLRDVETMFDDMYNLNSIPTNDKKFQ